MKTLLLDIEVAPMTGHFWKLWDVTVGLTQLLDPGYTLCWAAKWLGEEKVMFDRIRNDDPLRMLKKIHALIDEADAIITYNGKNFDMKILNKDFLLYGFAPPSPCKHIDLLVVAKKKFRFPSNKLDFISQQLGIGQKLKHSGHQLWRDVMDGKRAAWKEMEEYNRQDVVLLESLYYRLLPWIDHHPNAALYMESDVPVCPTCGSSDLESRGTTQTQVGVFRRYRCKNTACGKWARGRKNLLDKAQRENVLAEDLG